MSSSAADMDPLIMSDMPDSGIGASDGIDMDIPKRTMRVKVLYTFDDQNKTNCLTRLPGPQQIPVVRLDESTEVGIIELKICAQAIVAASPELVSKLEHDYTVYAYDFSEYETPLVGQGMLSWVLASQSPTPHAPATESRTMITGRVCRNILGLFSSGAQETLEVKLKLVPVPQRSQEEYVRTMESYRNLGNAVSDGFDMSTWSTMLQGNPGVDCLFHQEPSQQLQPLADATMSNVSTTGAFQDLLNNLGTDANGYPISANHPVHGSRSATPSMNPLVDATFSRPESRTSSRNEFTDMVDDGNYDEGSAPKRAKLTSTEWSGKGSFGTSNDSLRVAASTAASLRGIRPGPIGSASVACDLLPRAPTPRPGEKVRRVSITSAVTTRNFHTAMQASQSHQQSAVEVSTPGSCPNLYSDDVLQFPSSPNIPSSPPECPIQDNSTLPTRQSSPAVEPVHDSGFQSDALTESVEPKKKPRRRQKPQPKPPAPKRSNTIEFQMETPGPEDRLPKTVLLSRTQSQAMSAVSAKGTKRVRSRPVRSAMSQTSPPETGQPSPPCSSQPSPNLPYDTPPRDNLESTQSSPGPTRLTLPRDAASATAEPGASRNSAASTADAERNMNSSPEPANGTIASFNAIVPASTPAAAQVPTPSAITNVVQSVEQDGTTPRLSLPGYAASTRESSAGPSQGNIVLPKRNPNSRQGQNSRGVRMLARSQSMIGPSSDFDSDGVIGNEDLVFGYKNRPLSEGQARRQKTITDQLHKAVAAGQRPKYCSNCGEINTPTWRPYWIRVESGTGEHLKNHPGVQWIEPLRTDPDGTITTYRIYKQWSHLTTEERDCQMYEQHMFCNPCGDWIRKHKAHRPQSRWEKISLDPEKLRSDKEKMDKERNERRRVRERAKRAAKRDAAASTPAPSSDVYQDPTRMSSAQPPLMENPTSMFSSLPPQALYTVPIAPKESATQGVQLTDAQQQVATSRQNASMSAPALMEQSKLEPSTMVSNNSNQRERNSDVQNQIPRSDPVWETEDQRLAMELRRAIQSSPAGRLGTKHSPIDILDDRNLTPKPVQRQLFPSPRSEGQFKSLSDGPVKNTTPDTTKDQDLQNTRASESQQTFDVLENFNLSQNIDLSGADDLGLLDHSQGFDGNIFHDDQASLDISSHQNFIDINVAPPNAQEPMSGQAKESTQEPGAVEDEQEDKENMPPANSFDDDLAYLFEFTQTPIASPAMSRIKTTSANARETSASENETLNSEQEASDSNLIDASSNDVANTEANTEGDKATTGHQAPLNLNNDAESNLNSPPKLEQGDRANSRNGQSQTKETPSSQHQMVPRPRYIPPDLQPSRFVQGLNAPHVASPKQSTSPINFNRHMLDFFFDTRNDCRLNGVSIPDLEDEVCLVESDRIKSSSGTGIGENTVAGA